MSESTEPVAVPAATRFKVGDKLRHIHAPYLPTATVTEITERGFKYDLERPLVISPRLGTQIGGESYDDTQWTFADVPEPAAPLGLLAFKWADTLSGGEQDVLRTSSIRRLQNAINDAVNTRAAAQPAPSIDVEKYIAEAEVLSNQGRFDDAFGVLVNTLRSMKTAKPAAEPVGARERPRCCSLAIATQDNPIFEGKELVCDTCGQTWFYHSVGGWKLEPVVSTAEPESVTSLLGKYKDNPLFERAFQQPTPTTELQAQRAAEELYQQGCGHVMEVDEITAIILRHLHEPKNWIDNIVGTFDNSPTYAQVIENEKRARVAMEEGRCPTCGVAEPLVSAAIAEVERLRDKWADEAAAKGRAFSDKATTAEQIIAALRALPPTEPPTNEAKE